MALFENFPYTNFHEMNADWLINTLKKLSAEWLSYNQNWEKWKNDTDAAFKELKTFVNDYFDNLDVQEEINNKLDEMAEDGTLNELFDGYFDVLVDVLEPMAKKGILQSYNYEALTKIGDAEIPEGHTCQGAELVGDYLYIAHHLSDTANMNISKYEYPTLTLVETLELDANIHGNGLAKAPNNMLMLTDARSNSFYFIDLNSFTYVDKYTYTGAGISAAAFNHYGDMMAINPAAHCKPTILQKSNIIENQYVQIYNVHSTPKGNSAVQDVAGSNTFMYFLCSTTENTEQYSPNFIRLIGWNGVHFKDIWLQPDLPELEGITRISNESKILITDINGGVYIFDGQDGIISSSFWSNSIQSFDEELSIACHVDKAKIIGRATVNGHSHRIDVKIPFVNNNMAGSNIGGLAGRSGVYGGALMGWGIPFPFITNISGAISGLILEPRTNTLAILSYALDANMGYQTLGSYQLSYTKPDGTRGFIIKTGLATKTAEEVATSWATDIEAIMTETGVASLLNYNVYFNRPIGEPNFIEASQMVIDIPANE